MDVVFSYQVLQNIIGGRFGIDERIKPKAIHLQSVILSREQNQSSWAHKLIEGQ